MDKELEAAAERYRRGDLEGALALYRQAGADNNAGVVLRQLGRFAEAEAVFAAASDDSDAAYHLAMMQLARGDFAKGWASFERRPAIEEMRVSRSPLLERQWDGSDPAGRRLFLWSEQGFGDTIQFLRFVAPLQAAGADIALDCHPELARLLRTSLPGVEVVPRGGRVAGFEIAAALLSLPFLNGFKGLEDIPAEVPYLRPPSDQVAIWQHRLEALPRPRIGLIWAGRPSHPDEQLRSLPATALAPLLDLPASFVSLQLGASEVAARLFDPTPEIADFADTAAIVSQLDLVVSVDTSVAHLAGALARPVWVLLSMVADWRWLRERESSPWYPTMRLFRQPTLNDWPGAIAALRDEMADWLQ